MKNGGDRMEEREGINDFQFFSINHLIRIEIIDTGKNSFVKNGIRKNEMDERMVFPKAEKIIRGIEIVSLTLGDIRIATNSGIKRDSFLDIR